MQRQLLPFFSLNSIYENIFKITYVRYIQRVIKNIFFTLKANTNTNKPMTITPIMVRGDSGWLGRWEVGGGRRGWRGPPQGLGVPGDSLG